MKPHTNAVKKNGMNDESQIIKLINISKIKNFLQHSLYMQEYLKTNDKNPCLSLAALMFGN